MTHTRRATVFDCHGQSLIGVLDAPEGSRRVGLLIVVGGPQYRIGSHRQFALMARDIALQGFPVFRFDYRGMGDSPAEDVGFEGCSDDIQSAIDEFIAVSGVEKVVLWGLCDGASACMMFGGRDRRVAGMVLANPWVRSDAGRARAYLRHYYLRRVLSRGFWTKVFGRRLSVRQSIGSLLGNVRSATVSEERQQTPSGRSQKDFRERMFAGLKEFNHPAVFLLSGADLTATEFSDYVSRLKPWRRLMRRTTISQIEFPLMDHTFSSPSRRQQIVDATVTFLSRFDTD